MKTPCSDSVPKDFQIKHFLPKSCPVSGGGKLILVCGNVPKSKAKVCLQVFDVYDKVKWSKEFLPGKKTRPDTRLPQSSAGGQGPYLRSLEHLGRSSEVKE